ncbi:hypothetical protein AKJ16_DCAP02636 [Drosera capensis]
MVSTGLQLNRSRGDDRFYNPAKARWNLYQNHCQQQQQQYQKNRLAPTDSATVVVEGGEDKFNNKSAAKEEDEKKKKAKEPARPVPDWEPPADPSLCNLERFIASITPSVNAQYFSKTTMRGLRTCDVEYQPYFVLGDLWESFGEWSAYGAGVPIVLDGCDSIVQYYVPYLSAMQIYVDVSKSSVKLRIPDQSSVVPPTDHVKRDPNAWTETSTLASTMVRTPNLTGMKDFLLLVATKRTSEDSDGNSLGRGSSSDDTSDSERDLKMAQAKGAQNRPYQAANISLKLERLSLEKQRMLLQGGFWNNDGEPGNSREYLLFEFLERALPHTREPLAEKITQLADFFLDLKTLRSCDVFPSSWFSVAWYPIYRIPTVPTLKDLDACFLTYHCLRTPVGGDVTTAACAPVLSFPEEMDGMPRIALPVFGLASYKFRSASWLRDRRSDRQLVEALKESAKNWVNSLQVDHPDYQFFCYRK